MKIICSKNELLKGINIVMRAIPSRTTMPILECIFIDAQGANITFSSNDIEMAIETGVTGQIVERGTHKELVHAGGTYQELYETQFSKAEQ